MPANAEEKDNFFRAKSMSDSSFSWISNGWPTNRPGGHMLSLIELALLIAVFFTLRALSRWLKAYVARVEYNDLRMKALALFAAVLPFPAPGKTGVARHVFWVPAQLLVLIVLYVTYCMARIAYWDHEVRQLCAKDGGVTIYERIEISKEEAELLSDGNGKLTAQFKGAFFKKGMPVYASEFQDTLTHKGRPSVGKRAYTINRVTDDRVLASVVRYSRGDGDPFGPWEPSYFICPDTMILDQSEQKIYFIK